MDFSFADIVYEQSFLLILAALTLFITILSLHWKLALAQIVLFGGFFVFSPAGTAFLFWLFAAIQIIFCIGMILHLFAVIHYDYQLALEKTSLAPSKLIRNGGHGATFINKMMK